MRGESRPASQVRPTPTRTATETPGAADRVGEFLPGWVPEWTIQLVLAALVLVATVYLSRLVRRVLGRRVARRFQRPSVTRAVLRSIQAVVLVLGVIAALNILGLRIGDIVLSVTVFSAVVGFVLAPIIGNVINGLFVLSEQPYEIGDMIYLPDRDTYGFVEDITLRYTKVFTLDNTFLVVPNGAMRDRDVLNFSAEDSRTRLRLDVLVTYESDLPQARELTERAARQVDGVIEGGPDIRIGSARYPASPTCSVNEFADHGVLLTLRYWVNEPYRLLATRSDVQARLWELVDGEDVEFAYPHQHLVFDETSGEMQVALRGDGPGGGPPRETGDGPPHETGAGGPDRRTGDQ